ncbi:MAG: anthranilate phosphoribosyltransferase [Methanomassiliicoccales archaeon]|nr:anthranilate phosphoribosyltransferase [Methanomassiliicoccales archaeon]
MSEAELVDQAHRLACDMLEGRLSDRGIADRLMELGERGESAEELLGMTYAFYGQSVRVPTVHQVVMDLCGTGGAKVRTLNVSTISSFIVAAAGVPVAKHGNRSSQGKCGSADLLEAIGADISPGPQRCAEMLDGIGYAFFFAPNFHPAMRQVAKARKMVPRRTIFNVMGPLMNPVLGPRRHLMGVCEPRLLGTIPPVLDALGVDRAMLVHGQPGMDEVSLCGSTSVAEMRDGSVERYEMVPEDLGLDRCAPEAVGELTPQASARCCYELLRGRRDRRRDMVLLNSACALYIFGRSRDVASGLSLAERTLDSGKAYSKMQEYIVASRGAS